MSGWHSIILFWFAWENLANQFIYFRTRLILRTLWSTLVFDNIEDVRNSNIHTQQRGFHNGPCCSPCTSDNSHPNSSVDRQRNFSYSHIHKFVVTWIALTPDWTAVIWPTTERWAGTVLNASEKNKASKFRLTALSLGCKFNRTAR